jgi:hypothetical protein
MEVQGERRYSSYSLMISAPAVLYDRGKDPRYPLYRRLGGPQSLDIEVRRKILLPLPGIEPQ